MLKMDVEKILWIVPIIPQIFFIILLFFNKNKGHLSISFNSFYLIIINILSLLLYHLSFGLDILHSNQSLKFSFLIVFFFSYIIRIKRILNILSLSCLFKAKNIKGKDKSKILYEKVSISFEFSYFFKIIFLSAFFISIFYLYELTLTIIYIIEFISLIISLFLIIKIFSSDMKKIFRAMYSVEILFFFLLFINGFLLKKNFLNFPIFHLKLCFYLIEILYIILLSINYKLFSSAHIIKKNCLLNKKLNSDFSLFLNNELYFHSFISFIKNSENNKELQIILKIYLDLNRYTINSSLDKKDENTENIIQFINDNIQCIKIKTLKEKLNKEEKNFDEIYKIVYNILNKKYEEYKKDGEYENISIFIDLICYLDEYIFSKQFYSEFYENEELEIIQ